MYSVVACGFSPARLEWVADPSSVTVLPSPQDPEFVTRAFEALSERPFERALLVHESNPLATRRTRTLRAMLQTSGVVPVPLRRPLTGLAAHATWLAGLAARDVPAGLALTAVPMMEARLPTYAVTTSVARLALPEVKIHHHVLSWLPGTTFGVVADTGVRLGSGAPEPGPGPTNDESADLVWSGDRRLEPRLDRTRPGRVLESQELRPEGDRPWWGNARAFEHTVVPRDVDGFVAALHDSTPASCPQCGEAVRGHCSFCNSREGVAA